MRASSCPAVTDVPGGWETTEARRPSKGADTSASPPGGRHQLARHSNRGAEGLLLHDRGSKVEGPLLFL
jgi:hypothetical protein